MSVLTFDPDRVMADARRTEGLDDVAPASGGEADHRLLALRGVDR